jgi:hypothetical protein
MGFSCGKYTPAFYSYTAYHDSTAFFPGQAPAAEKTGFGNHLRKTNWDLSC